MQMPLNVRPSDFARVRPRQLVWLALACVAGTAFAATRPILYHSEQTRLVGNLTIVGPRATTGVVTRWAAILRREHPGVRIIVMPLGAGAAAGAMADGDADVASMMRRMRPSERAMASAANNAVHGVLVGYTAPARRPLYIYVNNAGTGGNRAGAEFLRVALSGEGQAQVRASGLLALGSAGARSDVDDFGG
ncbi:MAG: hypothetical protein JSR79_01760 [Proteobacteria bacterium]|nr:hypothetical protein [Pseudomonadota bacterium]